MKFHVCEDYINKEYIVDIPYEVQRFCIWLDFFEEPEDIVKIVEAISHNYCWEKLLKERKCLFNYEDIPR